MAYPRDVSILKNCYLRLTVSRDLLLSKPFFTLALTTGPSFSDFLRRHCLGVALTDKPFVALTNCLRLSKTLELLSLEITPNLTRNRSEGTLRYLLHRRFNEQLMETANFNDMVQQAVETCPHLAPYLLTVLCDQYNNVAEAARWAKTFQVPVDQWPQVLLQFVALSDDEKFQTVFQAPEEETTSEDGFLTIPLSLEDILVVDSEEKLDVALEKIEGSDMIGLDTEWQPIFGQSIEK